MTLPPISRTSGSRVPALAEVVDRIAAEESLTPRQKQETNFALRTAGRAPARRLEEIPAHPAHLRERLGALSPAMAGVSAGRWSNVISLTRAALKIAGIANMPGRYYRWLRGLDLDFVTYSARRG